MEIGSGRRDIEEVGVKGMKGKRAEAPRSETFFTSRSFQVSIEWW